MLELLKQLPAQDVPRKRGGGLHPAHALASEHFLEHSDERRDCVECSHQPANRARTQLICHSCKVHLGIGSCFARYHA